MIKNVVLFLLASVSFAQQPKFEANAHLVMVDAQVTEKVSGRIVDLLGPQDFEIYDDGKLLAIKEFHIETVPLDVVFVFTGFDGLWDAGDMRKFARVATAALSELREGDRAGVIRSAGDKGVTAPLGEDFRLATRALILPTSLNRKNCPIDAARNALEMFPRQDEYTRRRAVVVLTDDRDGCSRTTSEALASDMMNAGVTLNIVTLSAKPREGEGGIGNVRWKIRKPAQSGAGLLPAVAETGGEVVPHSQFETGFPELLRRVRGRYLLGFYSEAEAQPRFHRIEVRMKEEARKRYPNVEIKARRGYLSGPRTGTAGRD